MKKLLIIFATLLLFVCFVLGTTVIVSAEEHADGSVASTVYTFQDESATAIFTIENENDYKAKATSTETGDTVELSGTYTKQDDVITFYLGGEIFLEAQIGENNVLLQVEEVTQDSSIEDKLPTTDEVIDNMTSGTGISEEDKENIKDLVNKLKDYTDKSDSFFVRYIVPLIVAGVLCVLVGILLLLPLLRARAENRTLKSMYTSAKKQMEEAKNELKQCREEIDSGKIEKEVKEFIHKELGTISNMLEDALTKHGVEIEKTESILSSLLNGAINAWKASPEAVACLTQNADAKMLKNVVETNARLKAYIYQKYGEEAGKEISNM